MRTNCDTFRMLLTVCYRCASQRRNENRPPFQYQHSTTVFPENLRHRELHHIDMMNRSTKSIRSYSIVYVAVRSFQTSVLGTTLALSAYHRVSPKELKALGATSYRYAESLRQLQYTLDGSLLSLNTTSEQASYRPTATVSATATTERSKRRKPF
jgi:hypothetical protein